MKTIAFALASVATATTLAAVPAHAQSYADTDGPAVTLGAGVMYAPEYSGSDEYEATFLPMISAKTEITPGNTLYLRGLTVGLDHMVDERLTVGLMGAYRFGRDSDDSAKLNGMSDIDAAFEMGPKVRFQATPNLGLEANVLMDVSGAYDGFTARAGADYAMPLTEVTMLTFSGGLNYGSEDYMDTYYGVPAGQTTSTRPAYSAEGGLSHADVKVSVRHSFTHNWSVTGSAGADYLLGDAADSPLVDEELQPKVMLGVAYSF